MSRLIGMAKIRVMHQPDDDSEARLSISYITEEGNSFISFQILYSGERVGDILIDKGDDIVY